MVQQKTNQQTVHELECYTKIVARGDKQCEDWKNS